jgi:hypothetical protein
MDLDLVLNGQTKILPVPYFHQPTDNTCQSTCLKMMAAYLEQFVVSQSTDGRAVDADELQIYKQINESTDRPAKSGLNSHANMKWWLERRFPSLIFDYRVLTDEGTVGTTIVHSINSGMPVLMSVSHARVGGHIVLVVGYENYVPNMSSHDFHLVVHDPFGKFDPTLLSAVYGKRRMEGGMTLMQGGERAPGYSCRVPITSVGRQKKGDDRLGKYYLLSAHV